MTFTKDSDEALAIDMTPLVDCIFAIILFLLVASSFVEGMQQDLPIDLPTQGRELKVKATPARPVVVNVRNLPGNRPEYRIGGENAPLTIPELRQKLSIAKVHNADQSVVIRGDRNVKWEHVAAVMTTCADVGITKVSAAVAIDESRK